MLGIERNFSHRGVLEAKETELRESDFFSHFREIVEKKARLEAQESAELIVEIASEIDRQGIENFEVRRTPEADFPVTVVNVTRLFEKILAGKVPRREVLKDENLQERPERRTTLFLPGISPPPVGHPFTLWDYVYQQAYADLPRLVGAWRRGETLPEIEVRVFGSANSDWGRVTPEWLERVKSEGFKAHGEQVANYIGEILPEVDYLRLDGISMGALVALETLDYLSDDERAKMQVLLDNPADHQYKNRLLRVIRALQLPLGFGLDGARIFLTNPAYKQLYGGESGFLAKLNPFLSKKFDQSVPSEDFEQLALKKQVALSEALKIVQASPSPVDERVFVRKGISDVTTSTFGDVISLVSTKLKNWWHGQDKPFVRGDGKRLQFTVSAGHQRDNFMVQKWDRLLKRAQVKEYGQLEDGAVKEHNELFVTNVFNELKEVLTTERNLNELIPFVCDMIDRFVEGKIDQNKGENLEKVTFLFALGNRLKKGEITIKQLYFTLRLLFEDKNEVRKRVKIDHSGAPVPSGFYCFIFLKAYPEIWDKVIVSKLSQLGYGEVSFNEASSLPKKVLDDLDEIATVYVGQHYINDSRVTLPYHDDEEFLVSYNAVLDQLGFPEEKRTARPAAWANLEKEYRFAVFPHQQVSDLVVKHEMNHVKNPNLLLGHFGDSLNEAVTEYLSWPRVSRLKKFIRRRFFTDYISGYNRELNMLSEIEKTNKSLFAAIIARYKDDSPTQSLKMIRGLLNAYGLDGFLYLYQAHPDQFMSTALPDIVKPTSEVIGLLQQANKNT